MSGSKNNPRDIGYMPAGVFRALFDLGKNPHLWEDTSTRVLGECHGPFLRGMVQCGRGVTGLPVFLNPQTVA